MNLDERPVIAAPDDLAKFANHEGYFLPPLTGRFWTVDPAAGKITDPATLHKYIYAENNPVNAVDPTGEGALLEFLAELWTTTHDFIYAARVGCYTVTASTLAVEAVGFAASGFKSFPNPEIPY